MEFKKLTPDLMVVTGHEKIRYFGVFHAEIVKGTTLILTVSA